MDKKRGVLLVALFLLVMMSFSVNAGVGYNIICTSGSYAPGDYSTVDCVVDTSQTIFVTTTSVSEWRFNSFEIKGTDMNPVELTFEYTGDNKAEIGGTKDGKDGGTDGAPGAQSAYSEDWSYGGDGGSSGDRGGPGAGGGAGGNVSQRGGKGGKGGKPFGCFDSRATVNGGDSPGYAGANIKIYSKNLFKIDKGSIISKGADGNKGQDSNGRKDKCKSRAYGGGAGSGGSGGGTVIIEADTIYLNDGKIDVSGGKGGNGGSGQAETGNDDGGNGAAGGGGRGGSINFIYQTGFTKKENFDYLVAGGEIGTPGGCSECGAATASKKGYDGSTPSGTDLTELKPIDYTEDDLFFCSDSVDTDNDNDIDMQDSDCYDGSIGGTRICLEGGPSVDHEFFTLSQASSHTYNDSCCGDDEFRCEFKNTDTYLKFLDENLDVNCHDLSTKSECEAKSGDCLWAIGDSGTYYHDEDQGDYLCYNTSENWNTLLAGSATYDNRIITQKYGENTFDLLAGYGPKSKWYFCDAKGDNWINYSFDRLVSNFGSVTSSVPEENPEKYICNGYDNNSYFTECNDDNLGKRLYLFNYTGESTEKLCPSCKEGGNQNEFSYDFPVYDSPEDEVLSLTPFNYNVVGKFTDLEFDMKSDVKIDKIIIYDEDSNPHEKNIVSSQNWKHYNLSLSGISSIYKIAIYANVVDLTKKGISTVNLSHMGLTNSSSKYYCDKAGKFSWTNELDSAKKACELQKAFSWTGVSCCGDDTLGTYKEYYTVNPGEGYSAAGCYNGQYVKNGYSLYDFTQIEEDKNILTHYNGTATNFYSCNVLVSNNGPFITDGLTQAKTITFDEQDTCNSLAGYLCTDENKWEGFTEEKMIDAVQYISKSCDDDLNCITVDEAVTSDNCQDECPEGRECSWRKGSYIDNNGDEVEYSKCFVIPKNYSISSDESGSDSNCCPDNGCWDGDKCVSELTKDGDLICYQNDWRDEDEVKSWNPDRSASNYCTQENYCFVESLGNSFNLDGDSIITTDGEEKDLCPHTPLYLVDSVESGQEHPEDEGCAPGEIKTPIFEAPSVGGNGFCVPPNYYLDYVPDDSETVGKIDAYCYKGKWISRSSLAAAALLNYTKENEITNYSLFCDSANRSTTVGIDTSNNLNPVCVLRYNDGEEKRVSSIAIPPGSNLLNDDNFLDSLITIMVGNDEVELYNGYCDNVIDNTAGLENYNSFYSCKNDEDIDIWLNPYTQTILFTRYNNDFNVLEWSDWVTLFSRLISDPIQTIINLIKGETGVPSIFPSVNDLTILPIQNYNQLYVEKLNDKSIIGFVDNSNYEDSQYVSIEYENVSTDICDAVSKSKHGYFSKEAFDCVSSIEGDSWKFNLLSKNTKGITFPIILKLWTDLTSEIRLHSGGERPNALMLEVSPLRPIESNEINFTVSSLQPNFLSDKTLKWYYDKIDLDCTSTVCVINNSDDITYYKGDSFTIKLDVLNESGDIVKSISREYNINNPPVVSNLIITPENPEVGDNLFVNFDFHDNDGDDLVNSEVVWKNNAGDIVSSENSLVPENSGLYFVSVRVNDGAEWSDWKESSKVQVIESLCGNGKLDEGEECDYSDGDTDHCSESCLCEDGYHPDHDGECIADSICGNGKIEGDEECDGNNLGGNTCRSLDGFSRGTLACNGDCTFNTVHCYP